MNDSVIHRPAFIGPADEELPQTQPLDMSELVHAERPVDTAKD